MSEQDAIVRALRDPGFYPHRPARVVHHQTHISHVFVAGEFAFKLKKAVRLSFVDLSTVERRRALCAIEVELNRRLCAPLYLGVREVTRDAAGALALDGDGTPVEPLVWMRALPEDGMLPVALERGRVERAHLERFAAELARFHASPETALASAGAASPEALLGRWRHVLDDAAPMVGLRDDNEASSGALLDAAEHEILRDFGDAFVQRHDALLRARETAGRVRDGHGDLHAGNLCLVERALPPAHDAPPVEAGLYAFDCLEFSPELRAGDVACEVAFLSMDLTVRGHPELATAFVDAYVAATGDEELRLPLPFYECHRACVRGMVLGLAARNADASADERRASLELGRRHFAHAIRIACGAAGPALLVCCGLSGSGKTTVAVALAETTGFTLVSSDEMRKRLAGLDPHRPTPVAERDALYGEDARRAVYRTLAGEAERLLGEGRPVILDATYHRRAARDPLLHLARTLRVPLLLVECVADDATIRERLRRRRERPAEAAAGQPALSDAGYEVHAAQRAQAEPPREDEPAIRLDTAGAPDEVRRRAVRAFWTWRRAHATRAPVKPPA